MIDPQHALQTIPTDASLHVHQIDIVSERALVIRLPRESMRRASFLDNRILTASTEAVWLRLDALSQAARATAPNRRLCLIFHAGHVGSTLVSRLLDEIDSIVGLREPATLRSLAEIFDTANTPASLLGPRAAEALLCEQLLLWGRCFPGACTPIVKATSTAGRLAPQIFAQRGDLRAIYLTLAAEPYLATLLAGENSRVDLRGFASERVNRLNAYGIDPGKPVYTMVAGELAALAWLTESLSRRVAANAGGARLLCIDFDRFLAEIEGSLSQIAHHFSLDAPASYFANAAHSPPMRRYAKAPEHDYSPQLRAMILADARRRMTDEIRAGLRWLENRALEHSVVAELLG